ncbi:hypothetical protein V5O48_017142 [Marasmius crinis-equi]|uniref:Uncharacterized protein n=1 Tax=Marasmius crinis-equi TaxID=585013 RepID=A0ABR3EPT6_9AGAR
MRFILGLASRWRYINWADQLFETTEQLFPELEDQEFPLLETVVCEARLAEDVFGAIGGPRLTSVECQPDGSDPSVLHESMEIFPWNTIHHFDIGYDGRDTPVSVFNVLRLGSGLQLLVYHGGFEMLNM